MEAVLLIGVQGSGKSTFYVSRFFETHLRVSLDMLRTRRREQLVISACLAARQPFVVDNTNTLAAQRAGYIERARAAGFRVVGFHLATELKESIRRNKARAGKVIPVAALVGTFKRFELPAWSEGFDELYRVSVDAEGRFDVQPVEKPAEDAPAGPP